MSTIQFSDSTNSRVLASGKYGLMISKITSPMSNCLVTNMSPSISEWPRAMPNIVRAIKRRFRKTDAAAEPISASTDSAKHLVSLVREQVVGPTGPTTDFVVRSSLTASGRARCSRNDVRPWFASFEDQVFPGAAARLPLKLIGSSATAKTLATLFQESSALPTFFHVAGDVGEHGCFLAVLIARGDRGRSVELLLLLLAETLFKGIPPEQEPFLADFRLPALGREDNGPGEVGGGFAHPAAILSIIPHSEC